MPRTQQIQDLTQVPLDFTARGPELSVGLKRAIQELDRERKGFLVLNVEVPGAVVPTVMRRDDLYLIGFQSAGSWWRFSDAAWPLGPAASDLRHDGRYATLGGLGSGVIDRGAIAGIAKLADPAQRGHWKTSLRTLLVVVAENMRLTPVRMRVLGVMNSIPHGDQFQLEEVRRYVQDWDQASKGKDMSVARSGSLRTGFSDPTIVAR